MTIPTVVITDDEDATSGIITVMGPAMVSFHCTASAIGGGTWSESLPVWTFGDPTGRYNTLRGFSAAHFWDIEPEENTDYTVRCTLTNVNGETAYAERTVRLTPNTRRIVYIDPDDGVASPADPTNPATPYGTIASAVTGESNGSGLEYRFTAGKTHIWGAEVGGAGGKSNIICRSTIQGTKFTVNPTVDACMRYNNQGLLRDVYFSVGNRGSNTRMIEPRSSGTTIRLCVLDCVSIDPEVSICIGSAWVAGEDGSKSVLIQDTTASETYATIFFSGPMMTFLGVSCTHSGSERPWRGAGHHIMLYQCYGRYTASNGKTAITRHGGDFFWVSECEFDSRDASAALTTVGLGHSSSGKYINVNHVVFERNLCWANEALPAISMKPKNQSVIDCMVRNNICIGTILIGAAASDEIADGIAVLHNTISSTTLATRITVRDYYGSVVIQNNLSIGYQAGVPTSPETVRVSNTTLSESAAPEVTGNVMPVAYLNRDLRLDGASTRHTWAQFNVLGLGSGNRSKIVTLNSEYLPADIEDTDLLMTPPPEMGAVPEDYYGNPRSGSAWLVGAVGAVTTTRTVDIIVTFSLDVIYNMSTRMSKVMVREI
jgi:hypothetical protein